MSTNSISEKSVVSVSSVVYKKYKMKTITFILVILFIQILYSQNEKAPQWIFGKGNAEGTDTKQIRRDAVNDARANALKQAGIDIRASDVLIKTETNQQLTDFYSKFAETSSKGIILEERNVKVGKAEPLTENSDVYKIEVILEALVATQFGERDAGFDVTLDANRESYQENESVQLTITSTREGYLTLFYVHNDSLNVLFPNAIDKKNFLKANDTLRFPHSNSYQLTLETEAGKKSSFEEFIAVVTKGDIPVHNLSEMKIEQGNLQTKETMLTNYAKWLYEIPLDQRGSATKVLQVFKKEK
ncbi:MAG: DUF4384 domain-containing protein [Ignavibacteria bacterium]|nr:DUF4384 domain-containing protein [Ignavibacteria bacterium]